MTDHPITPPPELVEQWYEMADNASEDVIQEVAIQAARWGADRELEACLQWFSAFYCMETWMQKDLEKFRIARRPQPPSLAEAARLELDRLIALISSEDALAMAEPIRRALERLQELEQ